MTRTTCHLTISLDGFLAGPRQTREEPLGTGGERLHRWMFAPEPLPEADAAARADLLRPRGAFVMGRNMFGGGTGPWGEDAWTGWWGDEPPYHAPVFVLTHHAREPLELRGGTTFHFVTDGVDSALAGAREAAGERDILVAGGAEVVQQYLAAGLIDELTLSVAPVLLGGGTRFFADGAAADLEQIAAIDAPGVAHLRYRLRP
jgi:dihydrofolate reductase